MSPAPHLSTPELTYVEDDTFDPWLRAVARGFQEEFHADDTGLDRAVFANDRSFGFAVDGRWVATCGALTRELVVPGGASVPTAAVTVVTVHAPYRRRGLLTAMMRHQLEDVARRGEPLATLWASESLIYGRFGYGPAVTRAVLSGQTRKLEFLPDVRTAGSVDEVTREELLALAAPLHERLRSSRPGTMARTGERGWDFATYDAEHARGGASELRHVVHYDEAGQADGFATYRYKEEDDGAETASEVRIGELWAEEPTAHAGLWRYLLDLDLVRRFRLRSGPVDEPLRLLVRDARAVGTQVLDGLYVRVVDLPAALRARTYAAPLDVVLEVDDPILPANSGRWRLRSEGQGAVATVERVDTDPDVSLGVLELGTVYLGGTRLSELHRVARVAEHTPGAVAAASVAFATDRAPWCPDFF